MTFARLRKFTLPGILRIILIAFGLVSLGYVGYSLLDGMLYQVYANWRLETSLGSGANASTKSPETTATLQSQKDEGRIAEILPGSALGRLTIERLGIAVVIVEGTGYRDLRRAVGHIPGTALPGEGGNIALAGHRDTYFRPLRNIEMGDQITLATSRGTDRYRVEWMKVLQPNDVHVLDPSDGATLTLVTCYPFYFVGDAPQRFVVRAHRI